MMKIDLTQEILNKHYAFGIGMEKNQTQRISCKDKLNEKIQSAKDLDVKKLLVFLKNNIKEILIGTPEVLYSIISAVNKRKLFLLNNNKTKWNDFMEICKDVFVKDYDQFVDRELGLYDYWSAYKYLQELDVTICPYCNSQFVFHYYTDEGKSRPVLDHYFSKSDYPYLAISIQNLIPCCKVCNSDFKGTKKMEYNLNPFKEGFEDMAYFEKRIHKKENLDHYSSIIGESTNYDIIINFNRAPRALKEKIKRNSQLFHIEDIYNSYHKRYLNDLIIKSRIYNELYLSQLSETFNKLFNNHTEMKKHLIPDENEMNKVILSKLTKDIVQRELE
ncbi:hypothetical protein ACQKFO_19135 [Rossellomorea sp. NPDC071047]|uniref:hypothetical protein n=1 Tax=Rossellomorea sp. NPDC071047 TaxID=3390675 RepID=UPI003D078815